MSVVKHPALKQRENERKQAASDAAERWLRLREQYRTFCEVTWLGIMVREFSDEDLQTLRGFHLLSERDEQQLRAAKRGHAAPSEDA